MARKFDGDDYGGHHQFLSFATEIACSKEQCQSERLSFFFV